MEHTYNLIERSEVNSDAIRIRAGDQQRGNLQRDRGCGSRKISRRRLVLISGGDSAAQFLEIGFDGIMQAIVARVVSPEWNNRTNAIVPHERDNRLSFAHVIWTKAKDVVARNRERGSGATLANYQNVMGISIRLDHRDLGA